MRQIQRTDELYGQVERRAVEAGFASVDDLVAEVLISDVCDVTANLDHMLTADRLAHIDKVLAQIKAGSSTLLLKCGNTSRSDLAREPDKAPPPQVREPNCAVQRS